MSVMRIGLGGLIVALVGLGVAHAQTPTAPATVGGTPGNLPLYSQDGAEGADHRPPGGGQAGQPGGAAGAGAAGAAGDAPPIAMGVMSSWLLYPRAPGCCHPLGKCGPIGSEIFIRTGLAFPIGGGYFGENLKTGWDVDGGGRLLFFNPAVDQALAIGIGVSNIANQARRDAPSVTLFNVPIHTAIQSAGGTPTPVTFTEPSLALTVSNYNQTFVNASAGYLWYLLGTADPGQMGTNWRVGLDLGGRYGTSKVTFYEIQHHTDVVGGLFTALYSDYEIPWNCCIFQAGARLEYNYIWNDALQSENRSDYQSLNLLFQLGLRY